MKHEKTVHEKTQNSYSMFLSEKHMCFPEDKERKKRTNMKHIKKWGKESYQKMKKGKIKSQIQSFREEHICSTPRDRIKQRTCEHGKWKNARLKKSSKVWYGMLWNVMDGMERYGMEWKNKEWKVRKKTYRILCILLWNGMAWYGLKHENMKLENQKIWKPLPVAQSSRRGLFFNNIKYSYEQSHFSKYFVGKNMLKRCAIRFRVDPYL